MRWKLPRSGASRIKRRFLWLPLTINRERRWLEVASWEEAYSVRWKLWEPINWVSDEKV